MKRRIARKILKYYLFTDNGKYFGMGKLWYSKQTVRSAIKVLDKNTLSFWCSENEMFSGAGFGSVCRLAYRSKKLRQQLKISKASGSEL